MKLHIYYDTFAINREITRVTHKRDNKHDGKYRSKRLYIKVLRDSLNEE